MTCDIMSKYISSEFLSAHVASNMYHSWYSKNLPKLTGFCFSYLYNND